MLDLQQYGEFNYEVKWLDGTILHLRPATQGDLNRILNLQRIEDTEYQFSAMMDMVKRVLNSNKEGREFTEEEVSELPFQVTRILLEDYLQTVLDSLGE